jgi:hypothetical protein
MARENAADPLKRKREDVIMSQELTIQRRSTATIGLYERSGAKLNKGTG